MPTILHISCYSFLLPTDAKATAVMMALAGAIPMRSEYTGRKTIWFPSLPEDSPRINLEVIQPSQLRKSKPIPESRMIGQCP